MFCCVKSPASYSRTYWETFDSNIFSRFILKLASHSNSYSCRNFLHRVRSSDVFKRCEEFSSFTGSPIQTSPRHHQDPFRFAYSVLGLHLSWDGGVLEMKDFFPRGPMSISKRVTIFDSYLTLNWTL